MADTIEDVVLTSTVYQNVYTETSIVAGTALIIQNKSSTPVWVQISASQPDADSKDGYVVKADPRFPVKVETGANGCWVIGKGPISVQEA